MNHRRMAGTSRPCDELRVVTSMTLSLHRMRAPAAIVVALWAGACGDASIVAPYAARTDASFARTASVRQLPLATMGWTARARDLVTDMRTDPPMAARYYALLSVAQQR